MPSRAAGKVRSDKLQGCNANDPGHNSETLTRLEKVVAIVYLRARMIPTRKEKTINIARRKKNGQTHINVMDVTRRDKQAEQQWDNAAKCNVQKCAPLTCDTLRRSCMRVNAEIA